MLPRRVISNWRKPVLASTFLTSACTNIVTLAREKKNGNRPKIPALSGVSMTRATYLFPSNGQLAHQYKCEGEPHIVKALSSGCFPVQLGDKLESDCFEYQIVRKIGWGAGSTVWLARYNDSYGNVAYAALKILTTFATWANNNNAGQSSELALHSEIGSSFTDGQWPLGSEYCVHPSDFFVAMSERGGHFCVGLPVYGPSIHAIGREIFLSSGRVDDRRTLRTRISPISQHGGQQIPFSPKAAKKFRWQVFLALSHIHSLGLVHTDINASNIFLNVGYHPDDIAVLLQVSPSLTYEPRLDPELSPDPIVTVQTQSLDVYEGFNSGTAQRLWCRSSLVILGAPVDVWGTGCFVLMGFRIFNINAPAGMTRTEVHLARMQELLRPFPKAFIERCSKGDEFFDANGCLLKPFSSLSLLADVCVSALNKPDCLVRSLMHAKNFFAAVLKSTRK
ncbi:kinase-like domain-containing protein [Mycena olivaceomarginata]|nr:kinase-like domain-containing protein [Mycena olivaceomarginata]